MKATVNHKIGCLSRRNIRDGGHDIPMWVLRSNQSYGKNIVLICEDSNSLVPCYNVGDELQMDNGHNNSRLAIGEDYARN